MSMALGFKQLDLVLVKAEPILSMVKVFLRHESEDLVLVSQTKRVTKTLLVLVELNGLIFVLSL